VKRFVLLLLCVLAFPAAAAAAISGIGGGTTIANGQATLVSNSSNPYSFISFDDLNGAPLSALTSLSADVVSAQYGGGAPRFSVELSNGKSVFVYLGDAPSFGSGGAGDTGNLVAGGDLRVDTSQLPGGTFYDTWADAEALAGSATISSIDFVVDGDWATGGSQTVVLDSVTIDGTTYGFSPTSKDDCKNGGWQTFGYTNQGACVSAFASGK
jgi:hypothetical protein